MKKHNKIFNCAYLCLIFSLISISLSYSNTQTDSLHREIERTSDNNKLYSLYSDLLSQYMLNNDSNVIIIAQKKLNLAEKINSNKYIADSYKNLGESYQLVGNMYEAL